MKLFKKCVSLPGELKQSGQDGNAQSRRYREHSKVIADAGLIGAAVILVYAMVIIAVTGDTGSLPELIGVAAAVATASIGFYMWRAKAKDKLELRRKYGAEIYNDADIGDE